MCIHFIAERGLETLKEENIEISMSPNTTAADEASKVHEKSGNLEATTADITISKPGHASRSPTLVDKSNIKILYNNV